MNEPSQPYIPYPWQNQQWQVFQSLMSADKLPHAVLISGPTDVGKTHFSVALAARMLCQAPIDDFACMSCKDCQLVKAGSHPDLLLVEPEQKGKAISVDAIRNLAGFASQTALLGGWRVVLVSPVGAMTHNAANALLKTLEEPGKSTLLILVDHQQNELLATIRSRCQLFLFPIPNGALSLEWLRDNVGDGVEDYEALLETAGRRPLRAVSIAKEGALEQINQVKQMLADVAGGLLSPVQAAEQSKAIPAIELVEWMLTWHSKRLLDVGKENGQPARTHFVFLDQLLFARKLLQSKTNPNPQLLTEELLFGWQKVGP